MKIVGTRIHVLSDVFATVAFLDLKVPNTLMKDTII